MYTKDYSRKLFVLLPFVAWVGFGLCPVHAQTNTPNAAISSEHIAPRTIVKDLGDPNYPVGTMVILYDDKPIPAKVSFDAPDDWLRHISVSFRNRSSKALIAGSLQLSFPKLGGNPMLFYFVRFGITPEHQMYASSGEHVAHSRAEAPISIAPGATVTISFAREYDALRAAIESRSDLSHATSFVLDYGSFYFDDDLRWSVGSFRRADRNTPGKYVPAPPDDLMQKR